MVKILARVNQRIAAITLTFEGQDFNFILEDFPFDTSGTFSGKIENASVHGSQSKCLRIELWRSDDDGARRIFDSKLAFNGNDLKQGAIAAIGSKYPILRSMLQFV